MKNKFIISIILLIILTSCSSSFYGRIEDSNSIVYDDEGTTDHRIGEGSILKFIKKKGDYLGFKYKNDKKTYWLFSPKYTYLTSTKSNNEYSQSIYNPTSNKTYITGERGGCYYINVNNNRTYVDRSKCNSKDQYKPTITHFGRRYITGPRGGCYYINSNGNKTYVDRSICSITYKNSSFSNSRSGRTYVKGHYRTTKSGKRVYVKPHYRKK